MDTASSNLIGDRYLLENRTGGRGQVDFFDALDQALDRPVMVQMLTDEGAADESTSRAFLRHQQIASSIQNCPLRAVYDAGMWRGRPYSVMEREKGNPPESMYRPGYPPDVPALLGAARQIAESLQCCREAGLTDWSFAPSAVSIDAEGTALLGIVEGLGGSEASSRPSTDGAALLGILNLMLTGEVSPSEAAYRAALVPDWLIALAARLGGALTASDFAQQLSETEAVASQRTASFVPGGDGPSAGEASQGSAAGAPLVAASSPPDAPTLQAAQVPERGQTAAFGLPVDKLRQSSEPYTPPAITSGADRDIGRSRVPSLAVLIAALVLLGLLAAFLLPRFLTAPVAAHAAPTASAPSMVAVPDLRGKTLADAQNVLAASGLKLVTGQYVNDDAVTKDAVVQQDPLPGTQVQAGQPISVNLSLGPAATSTQSVQQPAPAQGNPPGNGNGNGKGHGKKGGH